MVGPAPERQIPSNPGCELGVTDAKISGNPGIYINTQLEVWIPNVSDKVDVRDLALRGKLILDQVEIELTRLSRLPTVVN